MTEERDPEGTPAWCVGAVMPADEVREDGEQLLEELVLRAGRREPHLGLEGERGELLSGGVGLRTKRADLLDDLAGRREQVGAREPVPGLVCGQPERSQQAGR